MASTAERLREVMKEKGLKQVDIINRSLPFQKKYGVNLFKSHLSQYVNGKSQPDQHKLFILAETLNVNEAWLMGYDVQKERQRIDNNEDKIQTIAAHHDGEDWTEEELEEIERFKEFVKSRRNKE